MYYQAEGCMNMETITFEEGSQGFIPPGSCFGYFSFIRHIASSKIFAAVFPASVIPSRMLSAIGFMASIPS
jgi:hypothetical protein